MEDLLIALLQGAVEFLGSFFEIFGQVLWEFVDWGWGSDLVEAFTRMIACLVGSFGEAWPGMGEGTRATWVSFLYLIIGLVTGAATLHFSHDVFLRRSASRMIALAFSPVLSGCASWIGAKYRQFCGALIQPRYYFWWGLSFTLGLCIVRFGFCHRPDW